MIRCYIGDNEIKRIIENIKKNKPTYEVEIILYEPIKNIEDLTTLNGFKLFLENKGNDEWILERLNGIREVIKK